jgi:hypothetical protein
LVFGGPKKLRTLPCLITLEEPVLDLLDFVPPLIDFSDATFASGLSFKGARDADPLSSVGIFAGFVFAFAFAFAVVGAVSSASSSSTDS